MRWTRGPWSSILLLVTVVNEKCQKETETEEAVSFFGTFLLLVKFQLGGGGFPGPPFLGYAYAPIEENKKGVRKFSVRFLAFSNKISTVQKIVLSSSRGHGNFRGLEASRPMPRTSKCVLEAKDVLPLVANTSSFAAGKSCQSWIMISASISKGRKKEKKFSQSASLVSLQRRLCLTKQANPIFTQAI